jgi:hypothetical protein
MKPSVSDLADTGEPAIAEVLAVLAGPPPGLGQ